MNKKAGSLLVGEKVMYSYMYSNLLMESVEEEEIDLSKSKGLALFYLVVSGIVINVSYFFPNALVYNGIDCSRVLTLVALMTSLLWAVKIPFCLIAIKKANLKHQLLLSKESKKHLMEVNKLDI